MSGCCDEGKENPQGAQAPIGNLISYADCPMESCDCIPLNGGVRNFSSGTSVNISAAVGVGAALDVLDAPSWATASLVGGNVVVTGTAPVGSHTLVYQVTNECSHECLVIKLAVSGVCTPPANIVKDIGYNNSDFSIDEEITIPGGSVVSQDFAGDVAVYSDELVLTAILTQPYPTSYSISMTSECGDYTVSGQITECKKPVLASIGGSSVLEKGVTASMSWVVAGSGNISIVSQEGVPSGMSLSITQNTPASGQATATLSGAPTDNPGEGEVRLSVSGKCGSLALSRQFTQQPCRELRVIGETGSSQMVAGSPVNYCKIVQGYEPRMVEYDNLPLGLSVSLAPHTSPNTWIVCISGTPLLDACKKSEDGRICDCATAKLRNSCGEYDVEFCFNLDLGQLNRPSYCVGVYSWDNATSTVTVWGVTPNTTLTIGGTGVSPSSMTVDATGYGAQVISIETPPLNQPTVCATISHPTCALVFKGAVTIKCVAPPAPPDPSN